MSIAWNVAAGEGINDVVAEMAEETLTLQPLTEGAGADAIDVGAGERVAIRAAVDAQVTEGFVDVAGVGQELADEAGQSASELGVETERGWGSAANAIAGNGGAGPCSGAESDLA
jgi:hypothetical protein